ncbi:uncharacterized protein BJX67DRAFT_352649 [Aspergillus lucknowensis]|uniref:DSBA-like thioredoxin domain-containing protein n=1 Tax=Aspergillus lucknowensis TaxID=176173 RepID=A0ABR4LSS2_9EURO
MQCRVAETLFEQEKDVGGVDVAVQAGVEGGMEERTARGVLNGDVSVEETVREAEEVRERGVYGVPHFFIGGEHHFDGADDIGEFFEVFVAASA